MSEPRQWLEHAYAGALQAHLRNPTEATLRTAYELGRDAVARQVSVVELAEVHHEVMLEAIADGDDRVALARLAAAGAQFLLDALSAFDLIQRGLWEERAAATGERHQADVLRQLTSFLADASLALDAPGAISEVLQLVADDAREATAATVAVATLDVGLALPSLAVSCSDGSEWGRHLTRSELEQARPPSSGYGLVSLRGDERRGWLVAPLTMLDGRVVGALDAIDREPPHSFGEIDERLLVQLAQIASAAIERALSYDPLSSRHLRARAPRRPR